MRNPLYHWTHLELARVFDIYDVLNPASARAIYDECTAKLQTEAYRGQELMKRFNVETVCTTDDPADSLEFHKQIKDNPFGVKVLPTWRPDKALAIENPEQYREYICSLAAAAGMEINNYQDLLDALKKRQDFFEEMGCRISDHGLDTFYAEDFEMEEIDRIFRSFLSYPRHEYFRRILCNLIGEDIQNGKLPKSEMSFIHQMVKVISYNNAYNYFQF